MHLRLAKLQEHRARLLAAFALEGQGSPSAKGTLPGASWRMPVSESNASSGRTRHVPCL